MSGAPRSRANLVLRDGYGAKPRSGGRSIEQLGGRESHSIAPWSAGQDGMVACCVAPWRLPQPDPHRLADDRLQDTPGRG